MDCHLLHGPGCQACIAHQCCQWWHAGSCLLACNASWPCCMHRIAGQLAGRSLLSTRGLCVPGWQGCMTCQSGCSACLAVPAFKSERPMMALCVVRLPLLATMTITSHTSLRWTSACCSPNPIKTCGPACHSAAVGMLVPDCLQLQPHYAVGGRGSCCCGGQDVAFICLL